MRSLSSHKHGLSAISVRATGVVRVPAHDSRKLVGPGWLVLLLLIASAVTGCGSGGYVGGGLQSISTPAFTIDAGQSYPVKATVSGNLPVSWSLSGASCSGAGCGSLAQSTGVTAVYTAPAGITAQMSVTLTAAIAGTPMADQVAITVNPDPTISMVLPAGTVGTPYTATVAASGGTAPITLSATNEVVPPGLSFNASTGVLAGTPTAAGVTKFTVKLVDSSVVPFTLSGPQSVTVTTAAVALSLAGNPGSGTVGTPYTASLIASGGVAPYNFGLLSGALPAGLSLSLTTGIISGTPTASGTSVFTAQVTDTNGQKATSSFTIVIAPANGSALSLTSGTLPGGTVGVPYSAIIGVTGGTAPYGCAFTAGTLPAGLSLNGCLVSGIPTTAGTSNLTVKATDSSNPAGTVTGPESITIAPAPALTITSPGPGTVNVPYTGTIGVTGGTGPYACAITAGALPAGLSLTGCVITGTPTSPGTTTITVKATDSGNPIISSTGPVTITINPSGLVITSGSLPNGTVNVPYSATLGVTGGTSPYTCSVLTGSLPAGLSFGANCLVTGTPTTSGTSSLTVKVTDSGNPTLATSGPVTVTILPAPTLTITSPPNGTVNVPYTGPIGVTGGTGPYTCKLTAGTLPAGLSLVGCTITGTPTAPGSSTVTVTATDSGNPPITGSGPVTVTINPAGLAISPGGLPNGTVGVPYSSTIGVTGGTSPYSCTITSGTLPTGLALGANCLVSGTPTVAGTVNLTVKATDSSNPVLTATGPVSLTISPAALAISPGGLPNGTVGVPYSSTIGVTGGTSPYTCTIISGTLPTGLALGANCLVSGTPTVAGTVNLTVKATDSSNPVLTATGPVSLTISPAALAISPGGLPNGTVGVPYSSTIGVTGGTSPYSCTITSGTLPTGLALGANCLVSGTPAVAGTVNLTVKATDSSNPVLTATGPVSLTISPAALAISPGGLPNGTVGKPYSATIGVTGGTSPYTCTITSGTLPSGLALGANCLVSGTPTVAGTVNLTVKATDSSNPVLTATGPVSLTINPAALSISTGTLPNGTVGIAYNAIIGVTGGTSPYTCTITSGTLPNGLALGANCLVSGTPTVAGTVNLTVKATDSSNPTLTATGPVSLTISPAGLAISPGGLPNGTVGVPYSSTIGVTGGTAPYTCTITSGTLPNGLALGANCLVSGTPTVAGTVNLTVKATDSGNPTLTATGPVSLTINPAALAISPGGLPNGTVGKPYSSTIGVTGGTAPYTCTITSGTLPNGLALGANCLVSGTPTVAGTVNLMVKATDSSNPILTATGPVSLTINPAPLAITTGTLPNGTVGTPYSSTIGVTGGTAPYTCTITSGMLPSGLALGANCLVSGTPTVAGTVNLTVKATDSGNPTLSATGPVSLTINPAPVTLVLGNPPAATINVPYSAPIPITGGTSPYTCTLNSGTLPAGLSLNNCTITGTPTATGSSTISVTATDSSNPKNTGTGPVVITVNNAAPTLTLSNPPNAMVATPYTGNIGVSGGTSPYTCTLTAGTVPAGLTLTNCTLTGTPTTAGSSTLTIKATDSSNPQGTITGPVVVTVLPVAKLTLTGSLPNGIVGVSYMQTLHAQGGVAPYTYAITAGSLPAGLSLATDGTISGTPTTVGASSFTVTATDTESTPQTASLPLVLLITYPTGPNDGELKGPYAFLFQGYDDELLGLFAYQTATIGSFNADGAGVLSSGELDANHQSTTSGTGQVSTNQLLGTYEIGADNRGLLTISTLNSDGTIANNTYAIAVKAPITPATTSAEGSMIEFDNDQLAGTKGSGTFMQQNPTAIAKGLTGSYAYGLQGDTPCLPTCTINLVAGPVAAVGQFTVNGAGAITEGTSDVNLGATELASEGVSGTYGAPDSVGRVQLSLATENTPGGPYPTDYAFYIIDATHAFVMSTDVHSSSILLAGNAQSQTLPTFDSTSLNGPFIGYENAATNPGLVGAILANTLNLSSATIFRSVGNGLGTCNATNVDQGGLTGLVNGLTGLGSGSSILNALLGTYESTGNAACTVATNGRAVINYPVPQGLLPFLLATLGLGDTPPPARIAYLAGVDRGYFLESGYAGLGQIEPQTGAPYDVTSLKGTFIYGEAPASSVATINASGILTTDGAGNASSVQDLNIGVGTLNILQLGVASGMEKYSYSGQDNTIGRFTLNGTTIIYEISPGRFVMVDTNPLTTSPSVTLLY